MCHIIKYFFIIALTLVFLLNSSTLHAKPIMAHRRLAKRELSIDNSVVTEASVSLTNTTAVPVVEKNYKHLCGSRLKQAIQKLCVEGLYTPTAGRGPRSGRIARDIVRRMPREVTKECCYRSCLESTLLKYCMPFTPRNTTTTTEAPHEQSFTESNSVDPENQMREENLYPRAAETHNQTEASTTQYSGEDNSQRDPSEYNVIAVDRETNDVYMY